MQENGETRSGLGNEVTVDGGVIHDAGELGETSTGTVAPGSRRMWLVAATVFVVVAVGVAVVAFRDDDRPTTAAGSDSAEYLVAGWLPHGWEPAWAELGSQRDDLGIPTGEIAVYGDVSLEDPWSGPVLTATRADGADSGDVPRDNRTEDITIGGAPGILQDEGEVVSASPTEPLEGEHHVGVTGYGLGRDVVVEAGEHLIGDPAIGSEGLPDGHEEIARGPLRAMTTAMAMPASNFAWIDGLAIAYGQPSGGEGLLALTQQPADDSGAAALIRLMALDPEWDGEDAVTEVRGQPAYILRSSGSPGGHAEMAEPGGSGLDSESEADGPAGRAPETVEPEVEILQWYEPSLGLVVSLMGTNTDEATVDRFVENLRLAGQDELDGLLDRFGAPTKPGPIVPLDEDEMEQFTDGDVETRERIEFPNLGDP